MNRMSRMFSGGAAAEYPWQIAPSCVVSWMPRSHPAGVNAGYSGSPEQVDTIVGEGPTSAYGMQQTWSVPWIISGPVARPVIVSSRASGTDVYHVAGCDQPAFRALFSGTLPWAFTVLFRFASGSDTTSCLVWNPTSYAIGTAGTHVGSCRGITGGDYVWGSQRAGVLGIHTDTPARDDQWHVMCYSFTGTEETMWLDGAVIATGPNTTSIGGAPQSAQLAAVTDGAAGAVEWGELAVFSGALSQSQVSRLTSTFRARNG